MDNKTTQRPATPPVDIGATSARVLLDSVPFPSGNPYVAGRLSANLDTITEADLQHAVRELEQARMVGKGVRLALPSGVRRYRVSLVKQLLRTGGTRG